MLLPLFLILLIVSAFPFCLCALLVNRTMDFIFGDFGVRFGAHISGAYEVVFWFHAALSGDEQGRDRKGNCERKQQNDSDS